MHACRYVGLFDASIAAYRRATRLDPAIRTSIAHSVFRPLPAFHAILERGRLRHAAAARAFTDADGPRLLGLPLEKH